MLVVKVTLAPAHTLLDAVLMLIDGTTLLLSPMIKAFEVTVLEEVQSAFEVKSQVI